MPVELNGDPAREGARILAICNACRYCEGYCAVFPALERRMNVASADLDYLANLCHNCAECYYACQYAPPHEFAVNVPKTLAEIRVRSYQHYAWPAPLAAAFRRNGPIAFLVLVIALAIWIAATNGSTASSAQFYEVISHRAMVAVFGGVSIFILIALAVGFARFWRESGASSESPANLSALKQALNDAFRLTYLHGDGEGCTYPQEQRSLARWWFHHLTFYGFLLCFAATSVAAIYHYAFGWRAPYGYFSLPVVLGTLGGVGLLAGPAGLFWLKQRGRCCNARPRARRHGPRVHRSAVFDQCHRPAPARAARNIRHAPAAGHPSGNRLGPICNAALWKVCARHLPPGGLGALRSRAIASERSERDWPLNPSPNRKSGP